MIARKIFRNEIKVITVALPVSNVLIVKMLSS